MATFLLITSFKVNLVIKWDRQLFTIAILTQLYRHRIANNTQSAIGNVQFCITNLLNKKCCLKCESLIDLFWFFFFFFCPFMQTPSSDITCCFLLRKHLLGTKPKSLAYCMNALVMEHFSYYSPGSQLKWEKNLPISLPTVRDIKVLFHTLIFWCYLLYNRRNIPLHVPNIRKLKEVIYRSVR